MPKRKYIKSERKYGSYKRRRRFKRRSAVIRRAPGMLGKTFKQRFRYCDQIELNATSGVPAVYSFRANSLFDPDYTGTGHQPIGFDQLMNFYTHYTVIGAKLTATFVSSSNNATQGAAICGIELSGSSTPTTTLNDIFEQGNTSYRTMTNSAAIGKVTVRKGVGMSKFLGQKVLNEDANAGTVGASPSELVWFHVFVAPTDVGISTFTTNIQIRLDQVAVLHEPKPLAGS